MNLDQLKKNVGQVVRLRPIAKRYDEAGTRLPEDDDDWQITDVTDAGVMIRNLATDHSRTLFRDQIHHYSSDQAVQGQVRGFLVLNVQLYLVGSEIHVEPTVRPGEEVDRPPPVRRASLLDLAAKMQGSRDFKERRQAYRNSPDAVREADAEFASFPRHFEGIAERLRAVMPSLQIAVKQQPFTMAILTLGYGVRLDWERYRNSLDRNTLSVRFWEGHPPFPGVTLTEEQSEYGIAREEFCWDLTEEGLHRWVEDRGQRRALTSEELAEMVLETVLHFRGASDRHGLR